MVARNEEEMASRSVIPVRAKRSFSHAGISSQVESTRAYRDSRLGGNDKGRASFLTDENDSRRWNLELEHNLSRSPRWKIPVESVGVDGYATRVYFQTRDGTARRIYRTDFGATVATTGPAFTRRLNEGAHDECIDKP